MGKGMYRNILMQRRWAVLLFPDCTEKSSVHSQPCNIFVFHNCLFHLASNVKFKIDQVYHWLEVWGMSVLLQADVHKGLTDHIYVCLSPFTSNCIYCVELFCHFLHPQQPLVSIHCSMKINCRLETYFT